MSAHRRPRHPFLPAAHPTVPAAHPAVRAARPGPPLTLRRALPVTLPLALPTGAVLPAALAFLLAVVGLTLVTGAPLALAAPGSAAPTATPSSARAPSPSASADPAQDDARVEVRVTQVTPQVVRPSDELVVRATVRNTGDTALAAPQASLRINRFLQSTRSSLEQWATLDLDGTAGTTVAHLPLRGPLPAGGSADVELRVAASELGLSGAGAAWGPRGLSVELTDAGRREGIARTFVLWLPTDQPVTPTRVSVLVPLTGGPVDPLATAAAGTTPGTDGADGSSADATPGAATAPGTGDTGTGAGAEDGEDAPPTPGDTGVAPTDPASPDRSDVPDEEVVDRLARVLEATDDGAGVSWAVDPALVVGARTAPAGSAAQRWVERLTRAAPARDVLTLPSRDPDVAALAHGGGEVLAAEALAAAAATTDPGLGSPVRTDVAWPADPAPDLATVALAARSGASAVVVGGEALAADGLTYTPTGRATVATPAGDVAALVTDPDLSDQLDAPADATAAAAAQRILAETAVVTRERPNEQRHLLAVVGRDWEPDVGVASAQLTALASAPWVTMSPLSTLIGTPDPRLERAALPDRHVAEDEIPPGQIGALLRARAELAAFAGIVPEPARLLSGVDAAVLAPTAVAWRGDPAQRSLVVDAVVADLAAPRSGVSVVQGSELYLGSETGRFPLGLRNDLDQDVTVRLAVDPASPLLVIDEAQTVTIPARSEAQVRVPFHAVGSGDVAVSVSLLTPDGTAVAPPQRFTVRVRADWENVGTGVVAGLLGLALVVGIIRTIRRGQTANRGAGSTPVSEIARLGEDTP